MKILTVLWGFILFVHFDSFCHGNGENALRALYQMKEIRDSTDAKYADDVLRLELLPTHSFCYSQHTWFMDSLNQQPNSDKIWDEMFMSAFSKEGVGTRSFPHRRNTFEVVKNYISKESILYIYRFHFRIYLANYRLNIRDWRIFMCTCNMHISW
jgi:hypothetical protein